MNFKIISKQDILDALSESVQMTIGELNTSLKSLEGKQQITVKFNDESEICVNLTSKGIAVVQEQQPDCLPAEQRKEAISLKPRSAVFYVICFAAAFLGAFLGVLIKELLF